MACDGDGVEAVVGNVTSINCEGCDNCRPQPDEEEVTPDE